MQHHCRRSSNNVIIHPSLHAELLLPCNSLPPGGNGIAMLCNCCQDTGSRSQQKLEGLGLVLRKMSRAWVHLTAQQHGAVLFLLYIRTQPCALHLTGFVIAGYATIAWPGIQFVGTVFNSQKDRREERETKCA